MPNNSNEITRQRALDAGRRYRESHRAAIAERSLAKRRAAAKVRACEKARRQAIKAAPLLHRRTIRAAREALIAADPVLQADLVRASGDPIAIRSARHRARKREWYSRHRQEGEKYRKTNRARLNEYWRMHTKNTPTLRITRNLRSRLRELLPALKGRSSRSNKLTGCPRSVLHTHLESLFLPGMSWANYGSAWHVDHITPCASFNLLDPEQVAKCFHYTNLQPLWDAVNTVKSSRVMSKGDLDYEVAMTPYPC